MKTAPCLLLALVGCTSTPDTPDTSNTPHLDFVSGDYTLQPGDEKYFCYTTNLPADQDIAITKLIPTYGQGTHHILFSQALAPEPEGFSECPVLSRSSWVVMYAGGKDSGPLELPPHIGFKPFAPGQQLVMQLHLQNATDAPITARAAMRMEYAEAAPDIMQAGVFGLDNRTIEIPPHSSSALTEMSCVVNADIDAFAVLGHMHKHGLHLDLSRGAAAGDDMLYNETWNFDTQPVTPLPLKIKQGDNLFLRCMHENNSDVALRYGESSDTEMCALVLYYAPVEGRGGCVKR